MYLRGFSLSYLSFNIHKKRRRKKLDTMSILLYNMDQSSYFLLEFLGNDCCSIFPLSYLNKSTIDIEI